MKKLFTTLALVALSATAFAQLDFGVGYLNQTMKLTVSASGYTESESENLNGFYVGADYTVAKLGPVNVTPGAYLALSSYKETNGKASFFALDIPVNFSYGIDFSSAVRGFIYAGPTFEIGITADEKAGDVSYNMYEDMLKRFDIKLGGGIGVDINSLIRVTAGYNAGLLNLLKKDIYPGVDTKCKTNQFHVGVAYLF
ncbi:MAG: porin family protein [Bacteroidales bacterium]|nr:porin family protein [Bacteroidales bacterium]